MRLFFVAAYQVLFVFTLVRPQHQQLQNLFRGRSAPLSSQQHASILPDGVPLEEYASEHATTAKRAGIIAIPADVWNETELNVQLIGDEETLHFQQDPADQPTENQFLGKNFTTDDTIILMKTYVTPEKVPVVTGSVLSNETTYRIRQLPNHTMLVEEQEEYDPEYEFDVEYEADPSDYDANDLLQFDNGDLDDDSPGELRRLGQDNGGQLDVLVLYTRKAMCEAAGYSDKSCSASAANKGTIEGLIHLAVEEANIAFQNSDIPTRLRLVHIHYDNSYNEDNYGWSTLVSHLGGIKDGKLDYVHAMRDQYGADFVSMFVDKKGYCGAGYRSDNSVAERAFSVVRWSCATGHYSFIHELAHNMGCRHNRRDTDANAADIDGYNYGYQYQDRNGRHSFRSIMAYSCPDTNCPRIQYFSNPSKSYRGNSIGGQNEDNARWIRERLHIYANFRLSNVQQGLTQAQIPPSPTHTAATSFFPEKQSKQLSSSESSRLVGASGSMFDIVAKKKIVITNFAVRAYSSTSVTVEVWKMKRTGSFRGRARRQNAWTRIGVASFVTDENTLTALPPRTFQPVSVDENDTQAFYITFHSSTNYNTYIRGTKVGNVHVENEDIQLLEGVGVDYMFGRNYRARVFAGSIFYEEVQPRKQLQTLRGGERLHSVTTTFRAGSGQGGNMFAIEAQQDISVAAFDIHVMTTRTVRVQIYSRAGHFKGFEQNEAGWTKICDTSVVGKGVTKPTHIPKETVERIRLTANSVHSFYITLTTPLMRYSPEAVSSTTDGDARIKFIDSVGIKYAFNKVFANRLWNGSIYYYSDVAS